MATKAGKLSTQKSAPVLPENTKASFQVSLPQMLDLALGTPEVGAVNFNILHNFLHVVLHQINLRTTKVEYRGNDADRVKTMVASLKKGPTLHLHEYSITDGSGKVKQRIHSNDNLTVNLDIYTDNHLKEKSSKGSMSARTEKKMETESGGNNVKKQQTGGGKEEKSESIILVERVVDGTTPSSLNFKKLENSVQKLQQQYQVLEELASNPELINKVKGNSTDPLTDMWQIINIKKRLDASEQGINKLTSMLQDLIKGDKIEVQNGPDLSSQLTEIDQRLENLEKSFADSSQENNSSPKNIEAKDRETTDSKIDSKRKEESSGEPEKIKEQDKAGSDEKETEGQENLTKIRKEFNNLKNDVTQIRNDIGVLKSELEELTKDNPTGKNFKSGDSGDKKDTIDESSDKNQNVTGVSAEGKKKLDGSPVVDKISKNQEESGKSKSPASATNGKDGNDENISEYLEAVQNLQNICSNAVNELSTRIEKVEKDTSVLLEATRDSPTNNVSAEGRQNNKELDSKIQKIQTEIEKLNQKANKIIEDKENLSTNNNDLQQQIEVLKTVKADKEDLEDALANKADTDTVNRKVSCDQFDATCDDLTRGIEEAIGKLNQQESVWQQTLNDVQKEIENKLDKEEISPFKESVDNRLKGLQEKVKILLAMREPSEAAASKKMIRDIQCLSCDRDVVMKVHDNTPSYAPAFRSSKSMKPNLNYESEEIKRQQRKLPQGKNFQASLQEEKKFKSKEAEDTRKHLCNRYCGGSHTIITPAQKKLKSGHSVNQWEPQVIQLSRGLIEGSDGRMYRGQIMTDKFSDRGMKICDPCDNKCNDQPTSKQEDLAPVSSPQNVEKKDSHLSEIVIKELSARTLVESEGKVSQETSKLALSEEPQPPPSSPLRKQSFEEDELLEDNLDQPQSPAEIIEVGSFINESKLIDKIAFEEEGHEEIEGED